MGASGFIYLRFLKTREVKYKSLKKIDLDQRRNEAEEEAI